MTALQRMIRDLHRPRGRERRGLLLLEGVRLVEEAVAAGLVLKAVVTSPSLLSTPRGRALRDRLAAGGEVTEIGDQELAGLATTEQPQGVLVVAEPRPWTLRDIVITSGSVVAVLDAIQDPGNVGTILRTAWGLGAAGAICLPGTAELGSPKTVRASMGAVFRMPVVTLDAEHAGRWVAEGRISVATADARGTPLSEVSWPKPLALVLGNEGSGVQAELGGWAAVRVAIPLAPGVDSLNVAVAAGILLYGALCDR